MSLSYYAEHALCCKIRILRQFHDRIIFDNSKTKYFGTYPTCEHILPFKFIAQFYVFTQTDRANSAGPDLSYQDQHYLTFGRTAAF